MMHNAVLALAVLFAAFIFAPNPATSNDPSQVLRVSAARAFGGGTPQQLKIPENAVFLGKLLTDVDAQTAKPGDSVEALTVEDVKSGREVLLEKGVTVSGVVVAVKAIALENRASVIGMHFGKVTLKGGEQRSVVIGIEALAPPAGSRPQETGPKGRIALVGDLDHDSRGACDMPSVLLGYRYSHGEYISELESTSENVHLKRGMQVLFKGTGK
jgi:hypothetical protein